MRPANSTSARPLAEYDDLDSLDQDRQVKQAGEVLTQTVREVAKLDFQTIKRENRKLFDLLVGDACHAYHGTHMVRGENQV